MICIIIAFLVLFESISNLLKICSIGEYVFQVNHCVKVKNHLNQITRQDLVAFFGGMG